MSRLARWPGLRLVRPGGPTAPKPAPDTQPDVRLRRVEERDIETYLAAGVSSEIHRMYGGDPGNLPEPSVARARDWYTDITAETCAFMIEADGVAVGHLRLHGIDAHDGRGRLAIGLFREADLGRGIGRRAIEHVLNHGFMTLKLHRIDLRVLAFNTRAIRCYRACGFVHEGTEREACLIGNTWHDDWLMGILRPEYIARQSTQPEK
jgi:RimJ/RimL family protein N-acetyltransferase